MRILNQTTLIPPFKQARLTSSEDVQPPSHLENFEILGPENETQNSSDAEAEDAATVLEFLAWRRLKDSSLTTDLRDPGGANDLATYPEKDVLQTAQAWGNSPISASIGQQFMEPLHISQIQHMIPNREQVKMLIDYHANWILFLHSSFHVQTFNRELEQFYEADNGLINMTSTSLQWTSLMFALLTGSIISAKPAQVTKWGFHQGISALP